jgi:acyl carrier protein
MDARRCIRDFVIDTFFVADLGDDTSFLESGMIDSLGMAQLVAFVEERFDLRIADEELLPENLDSVARIAAFVERKRSTRSAA